VNRRVLLVGATGVFGSRLARLLSAMPGIELILAARHMDALNDLERDLRVQGAHCQIQSRVFDRRITEDLYTMKPWLVIDAAGPFQESDYALALAAVRCGAHSIDLADGRTFVADFPGALQAEALQAGVVAITGASSTPALSHAALEDLTRGWLRLDKVAVVISPGGRSPRGLSVTEAILSYAGKPLRVYRQSRWVEAAGWSGLRRLTMPGLGARWASICETPDLDLLKQRFDVADEALFLAGLDPPAMHLGLTLLSLLVRFRIVASLRPLARLLLSLAYPLTAFSSDRGGMVVLAEGVDAAGAPIRGRWALWAEKGSGPNTPAAPAAALVRKLLAGNGPPAGAYACTGLLSMIEIVRELDAFPIYWRID
jgi:hypothetical protein